MRYLITYIDNVNTEKPQQERVKDISIQDEETLPETISLLIKNRHVVISVEMLENL